LAEIPIDFGQIDKLGKKIYDAIVSHVSATFIPSWVTQLIAGVLTDFCMVLPICLAVVVQGVVGLGSFTATTFLQLVGEIRTKNSGDVNAVIAASVNELLGTSISAGQLPGGGSSPPGIDNLGALGDAVVGQFEKALGGLQPVSPEQGAANARKFAGFSLNFALSEGFLSILTEAASLGFLKEFHELPDAVRSSLGLGRLQRAALAPLIRNCISQPYDLYLKGLLRPDRLSEGQLVRALRAGDIQEAEVRQQLAQKGYRDSDIDILLKDLTAKIAASELSILVRYGDLTLDQAIAKLTAGGMDADAAKLLLKSQSEAKADTQVGGILSDLEAAYTDGFIDQMIFDAILSKLPLSDDEEQMYRLKVGAHMERPRKRISFAQLKAGIVAGFADFTYVDTWLNAEGYGHEDQMILTMEIIQAMDSAAAKAKAHAATAAKALAKGKQPPPAPAAAISAPNPPSNPPAPVQPPVQQHNPTT
jgi:hypothetical protein